MQRKMRARLYLKGTLFNSLAITVAKRENDENYTLLVCSEGTNIKANALFGCFMREPVNIMRRTTVNT